MHSHWSRGLLAGLVLLVPASALASPVGYYREPALSGNTLVFVAEGDLWKVPTAGGTASRITSAPGEEGTPAVSPDGTTLAFTASYEGPAEVYTMPLAGGLPDRRTYGSERPAVAGWTPDGKVIYRTRERSTLPNYQLAVIGAAGDAAGMGAMIPLSQAADGVYAPDGTFYFTRRPFQGSHTKRYQGGTAQNIWRFAGGGEEAQPLTADYPGASKRPMWWEGRIYFASDRDGTMNLWSMNPQGGDLVQHTHHAGFDVQSPYLDGGRIAYQLGADIHVYTIASGTDAAVPITLESDLDQMREHWIEKPMDYLTAAHASPDGDRVVLTARGEVFVAPRDRGRLVKVARAEGVRYREARFMPDGKTLVALSDQSGEVELWTLPANGVGAPVQLTDDAATLRWVAIPSPDGNFIAHTDKKQRLFLYDVKRKTNRQIDAALVDQISDLAWSPDSRWLAYVKPAANQFRQILVYRVSDGSITPVTTDRYDSTSPAWSRDGKWLYLLSDRNLTSAVTSIWGSYQPEPFLDKATEIYEIPLTVGLRSPFAPPDELAGADTKDTASDGKRAGKRGAEDSDASKPPRVTITLEGIGARIQKVPVPAGTYHGLTAAEKALFWVAAPLTQDTENLMGAPITNKDLEVKTVVEDIKDYELTGDAKQILVRKKDTFYVVPAEPKPVDLDKAAVDLSDWTLSVVPREEWRQMFDEAWRLERDYFYDPGMHGVDWPAMKAKYRPLVDRVTSREELSDLLGQMVSELSALHIYVYGGEMREGPDDVGNASLGAVFARDGAAGGYRVEHVYRTDPDEPGEAAPAARPAVNVTEGDVITRVNGIPALSAPDMGALLRNQAGKQVLLHVKPAKGPERDVVAVPITARQASDLRYDEWEYTRRLMTDSLSDGKIGYVHLRAMGSEDYTNWARDYYPVFTRDGLIVDVRHNRGGNIDSWILEKLMRKAWSYWSQPVGSSPTWNMQYAFRGHMVVLCDAYTASDGELFSEGFRKLGLGKVIGVRTWGGEIWLSSSNFLVDHGIATAAEYGVYGPRGAWLIEGHGVDPDIVVDNLPHATFEGGDAQLEAAVKLLQDEIRQNPVSPPTPPPYPDKSGN